MSEYFGRGVLDDPEIRREQLAKNERANDELCAVTLPVIDDHYCLIFADDSFCCEAHRGAFLAVFGA